jgi:hypothetical protein
MQSSRLHIKVALMFVLAVSIAACAAPTAVVHDIETNVPCPEWTNGQLGLAISVVPIAVPGTLTVSEGAIRPALWDLGVPTKFGAARKRWLALYSPAIGAVRAVFTTPEAASAFAVWLQQVGGAAAGKYSLGLFTPANPNEKGRILPFDTSIMDTFQPIAADEIALLKVGEIDKP